MNFARLSTMYWTKEISNLQSDGALVDADLDETFTKNLIEKANDWVVAVERFELSLNGVPYYGGVDNQEQIQIMTIVANGDDTQHSTINCYFNSYSLPDTLAQLTSVFANQGIASPAVAGNWKLTVNGEGFISFTSDNYDDHYPVWPAKLNYILGLFDNPGIGIWSSNTPRWGCGDELDHIRIKSNLNIVSDTVGQEKTNIVTDLSIFTSQSASGEAGDDKGYSYSARDKLIYTPNTRRYLNFNSTAPIQVIRVFCEQITPDGTTKMIRIPHGGVFNIKLAFFHRV